MTADVAKVLESAADLLEKPGAWTQHWFAKDDEGNELPELSRNATCWCMRGSIYATSPYLADDCWAPMVAAIGGASISDIETWNDKPNRTQEEVVAKLREAAALARAEASS